VGGAAEPARRPALSPPIEIARGLAALGVLLFHAYILVVGFDQDLSFFGGNAPRLFAEMPTPYLAGYVLFGFAFFRIPLLFVLSGYCVHLARAAAGPGGLDARRFLARRLLRLYPLYLAVVVSLFVLFGPLLGQHEKHGVNGTNLLGHLFFWHYAGPAAALSTGTTLLFFTIAP
jgi:peptidoglycan/LPS O-acetylase OafA/YrhL